MTYIHHEIINTVFSEHSPSHITTKFKSPKNLINNCRKKYRTSFYNNMRASSKSEINTPKGYKLNRTINFDVASKHIINKINLLKNNNSRQRIGDLYLKNKLKKFRNDKNKIRLINFKNGKSKTNPFDLNSINNKSPIFKKLNNYLDSFFDKTEMKRSFDSICFYKNPKYINQMTLEAKPNFTIQNRNNSNTLKKNKDYTNLKEYYSNICLKKDRFHLNKNKTDIHNFVIKDNQIENKDKKMNIKKKHIKCNNSVRNIEINL